MSDLEQVPPGVDATRPSPARMYDCYLGGTANFPVDRNAVDRILELVPEIRDAAWANRGFLQRAVRWMAVRGIEQFIDLGAGMPTQRCTHEVAREIRPSARVLYTDSDPGVVAHGREILAGADGTAMMHADIRDPERLLADQDARRLIEFSRPVGLLILAVTQFIPDADDPWRLVSRYVDALAPGSYLALSAPTADHMLASKIDRILHVYATSTVQGAVARTRSEIARFFTGLEIVPPYRGARPDLTSAGLWDCEDPEAAESDGSRSFYVAVARKPGDGLVAASAKPTVADLGIEPSALAWRGSSSGAGTIEVAFADALSQQWVLMRVRADPAERISVFTSYEWECFLDGAKSGEFDGTDR